MIGPLDSAAHSAHRHRRAPHAAFGTGQGAWKRIGANRFAFAFQTFVFTETGEPGGHVVVRSVVTLSNDTLSGPFRFNVYDPAGNVVESGSGTATATRFVIPEL